MNMICPAVCWTDRPEALSSKFQTLMSRNRPSASSDTIDNYLYGYSYGRGLIGADWVGFQSLYLTNIHGLMQARILALSDTLNCDDHLPEIPHFSTGPHRYLTPIANAAVSGGPYTYVTDVRNELAIYKLEVKVSNMVLHF